MDAKALLESLDVEDLRGRLDRLRGDQKALRVLLRAALARERGGRQRQQDDGDRRARGMVAMPKPFRFSPDLLRHLGEADLGAVVREPDVPEFVQRCLVAARQALRSHRRAKASAGELLGALVGLLEAAGSGPGIAAANNIKRAAAEAGLDINGRD
jgi:hypothetical protein